MDLTMLRIDRTASALLSVSLGIRNLTNAGDHDYLRISPRRFFFGFNLQRTKG